MDETTRPIGRMAVLAAADLAVGAAGLVKLPDFY